MSIFVAAGFTYAGHQSYERRARLPLKKYLVAQASRLCKILVGGPLKINQFPDDLHPHLIPKPEGDLVYRCL
jgi:hypothetical protein